MGPVGLRRRLAALASATLLLGLLGSAGPVAAAGPQSFSVDAGAGDATGVAALKFYPAAITVDAGDMITWKVAGNAHTISFLTAGQTPPAPDDPAAQAPAGGSSFDGSAYTSSGIKFPAPGQDTYALTFPTAGTYAFHCLIHPGMDGTVTVAAAGTAYPQDQAAITAANQAAEAADIATGHALEASFSPTTTTNSDGSKTYHLAAGVGSGGISILRYISSTLDVHVGDTVEWTNFDTNGEPHSVSFGPEPQDPSAMAPSGGSTYAGSGWVSSGLYVGPPIPAPHSYSLKFTKAGSYKYICVLHDVVGMNGSITVAAAPRQTSNPTPPPTSTLSAGATTGTSDASLGLAALALVALAALAAAYVAVRRRSLAG
ncbi:MAG: cupredoxin domain-containing protein [Candidatus Limnocylindrales bacterium]